MKPIVLEAVGAIRSPYKSREEAPKQGRDREEVSELVLRDTKVIKGLRGSRRLRVLYWMHEADRKVLWSHKRGRGIFATRSPERPNPIAVSVVEVVDWGEDVVRVKHLDALDGTPILALYPV
jgi:tRNA-Thr(GGU) m(6)t(6)A37 methyltransferase TsaA